MLFDSSALKRLAERADTLLSRVEALLPAQAAPDWDASVAFRWRRRPTAFGWQSWLQPVRHRSTIGLDDLQNIDEPKRLIERNTRRFVQGLPANNVLLTGSRGTGKSSLIKACLNAHVHEGLRLIEVENGNVVLSRAGDEQTDRARHGLYRALVKGMVEGVYRWYGTKGAVVWA